jgi:endonuclease/exonuclease/phosphatase (EEP) superfamily protein YafD
MSIHPIGLHLSSVESAYLIGKCERRPSLVSVNPAECSLLIRVISYNLRENHAVGEIVDLVANNALDVLCLQECNSADLPDEVGDLSLADSTKRNRLGLALYYRKARFTAVKSGTFALKKSLHDRVMAPAHERLLGTRLIDKETNRELVVASFHAAPLTAMNSLRRNQIRAAHNELRLLGEGLPALMVGDYNYPWFKKGLGEHVQENGYELTLSETRTYTRYKFFKGHFDFATSMGLRIDRVETLKQGLSDHMPILVTADYAS